MHFFLLNTKNIFKTFLYLLESLFSNHLSLIEDVFWANLRSVPLVLRVLHSFLCNKALKPFYYVINFIALNNLCKKL